MDFTGRNFKVHTFEDFGAVFEGRVEVVDSAAHVFGEWKVPSDQLAFL